MEEKADVEESEMKGWLEELAAAAERGGREEIFLVLRGLVPTFRSPEEVNREAIRAVREGQANQLEDLASVQRV